MAQSKKSGMMIMAKYMHMFFPENKAIQIDTCDLVSGFVEGTFDGGESSFSFRATKDQILELVACVDKTKVITSEDKKKNPDYEDEPKQALSTKPIAPESVPVKIILKEPTKTAAPSGFAPPTTAVPVDRQRLTKPGEQELMNAFENSWPNKYAGRRKLEPHEEKERNARNHAIDVARSYILSGDRTTVKTWVEYNKSMFG